MWQCSLCQTKNNNSSETCHGPDCKGIRGEIAMELPVSVVNEDIARDETVYDYCPVCIKDQYFSRNKKKAFKKLWMCHGCHNHFMKIGKTKPKPTELLAE